jgi:hypothetical protein
MHASSSQHKTAPIAGEKHGVQPAGAPGRNSDQHDLAACDQRPATAASGTRRTARTVGDSSGITGQGAQITGLCASEADRICRNENVAF